MFSLESKRRKDAGDTVSSQPLSQEWPQALVPTPPVPDAHERAETEERTPCPELPYDVVRVCLAFITAGRLSQTATTDLMHSLMFGTVCKTWHRALYDGIKHVEVSLPAFVRIYRHLNYVEKWRLQHFPYWSYSWVNWFELVSSVDISRVPNLHALSEPHKEPTGRLVPMSIEPHQPNRDCFVILARHLLPQLRSIQCVESVVESLVGAPQLERLVIRPDSLRAGSIVRPETWFDCLSQMPSLKCVKYHRNFRTHWLRCSQPIFALPQLKHLASFDTSLVLLEESVDSLSQIEDIINSMDNLQEIYLSDKLISWRDFVDTVGRLTKKPRVQRLLLRSKVSGSNTILWHTFKDAEAIKAVLALPTFTVDEILVPNSILLSTTTFKGTVEAIINYIHQKGELRRAEEWFCRFHPRRRSLLHELIGTPGFKLKHLKHVLSLGLDPNIVDIDGKCALARAVFQAEVDKVAMLLQHNANPNVAYSIGHFAVTNPIETFLALLVKHGMKLGIKSPLGNTLLHSAAQPILHIPTAWFLKWLTPDIDVNAQNYLGETALITAIKNGRHELAVELFRIGVDPRVSAKDGTTALHCAIGSKFDEDPTQSPLRETLLELLLSVPGIPLNNPTTKTPLCRAIAEQDVALVKRLLELGADPTIPHQKLGNALQYALKFSLFSSVALEIIEALLSTPYQEALLSTSTRDHPSVLCSAAAGLCFPFLKHFTPRFKDKLNDRSDINGLTVILFTLSRAIVVNLLPLMFPSSRHSALMFGKQVRDFDSRLSENQRRPFSVVVQSRVAQAIRSFVAHGADIYIKDNNGFSVAHYAALGGYIPVLQYLMELGLDLNIANYGVTPLHLAYLGNMTRTVRWLIDIGQVNQDAVDFRGMKPVQYGFIFARLHTPDYQNPDWEGDEDDEEEAY